MTLLEAKQQKPTANVTFILDRPFCAQADTVWQFSNPPLATGKIVGWPMLYVDGKLVNDSCGYKKYFDTSRECLFVD